MTIFCQKSFYIHPNFLLQIAQKKNPFTESAAARFRGARKQARPGPPSFLNPSRLSPLPPPLLSF
jgi:hypothetical protein